MWTKTLITAFSPLSSFGIGVFMKNQQATPYLYWYDELYTMGSQNVPEIVPIVTTPKG